MTRQPNLLVFFFLLFFESLYLPWLNHSSPFPISRAAVEVHLAILMLDKKGKKFNEILLNDFLVSNCFMCKSSNLGKEWRLSGKKTAGFILMPSLIHLKSCLGSFLEKKYQ